MIQIYTASAGNTGPAGWAFIITEEVKITGESVIQYSGCEKATKDTALAMAILQALYWVREHRPGSFVIYTPDVNAVNNRVLQSRIADMQPKPGNIIQLAKADAISELCASLAEKALYKMLHEPQSLYDSVDVGNTLIKKENLFSQSYIVMGKFLSSRTLALQNLTTVSKRVEVWSKTDFDNSKFINL